MVFGIFLAIHNLARWVVIIALVYVLVRSYLGWLGKRSWKPSDRMAGVIFTSALDVQLLLGILLIFLRGVTSIQARFYMEHIGMMILAVVLAHVGSSRAKKAGSDTDKHRLAAVWFSIVLLVILAAIPWTRPLLPSL